MLYPMLAVAGGVVSVVAAATVLYLIVDTQRLEAENRRLSRKTERLQLRVERMAANAAPPLPDPAGGVRDSRLDVGLADRVLGRARVARAAELVAARRKAA